jgi:hypothetical protein
LRANNVWCEELALIAVGRRFTMNRLASEFLSISVTRETRRTFCAAALKGRRKLQTEFGLEK